MIDTRMTKTGGVEYGLRFLATIRFPNFFHMQQRKHYSFGIAQGDLALCRRKRFRQIFGHIQSDGDWPENTAREAHLIANTLVVGLGHEASQRRKPSIEEKLEIAE